MKGLFLALGAALLTAACCSDTALTKPVRVKSQDQAAAVMVAATNVVQWDQVAAAMQPNFALSGDQALTQVLPATERIQEQVLKAFGASLGLGLPTRSTQSSATNTITSSTTTNVPATGPAATTGTGGTSSNNTTTTTAQPGTAPTAPSGVPAGAASLSNTPVTGDIGLDPLLKYQAALSLFESVQMMNREVQNAATLKCYVPFLVRIRLTVIPYRPNLGYSVNSRVAFFPNESKTGSGTAPMFRASDDQQRNPCDDGSYLPQIIPILAADDIERALKSRATEAAQQIGLALTAMVHGAGANLGLNSVNQTSGSLSGQDFNSRLAVARQSDNTLLVHVGATEQATAGLALMGQSYDVAVLLLAPRQYFCNGTDCSQPVDRQIRLVTNTEFRDAFDGTLLEDRSAATLVSQADQVMKQVLVGLPAKLNQWNALSVDDRETSARRIAAAVQASSYQDFLEVLKSPQTPFQLGTDCNFKDGRSRGCDLTDALWVSASKLLTDTAMKSAFFQLRVPDPIALVPDQTALLLDDGKIAAVTRLSLLTGSSAATLMGTLHLHSKPPDNLNYSLPSQAISVDPVSHLLSLTFPSPTVWGIKSVDTASKDSFLTISQVPCATESLCPPGVETPRKFNILLAKPQTDDPTPNFTLAQTTSLIVVGKSSSDGIAKASLTKLTDDSATLTVNAADLVSASDGAGAPLPLTNGSVTVTKDTVVVMSLKNLHTGTVVTVTAEGKKAGNSTGKKTLSYTVVAN